VKRDSRHSTLGSSELVEKHRARSTSAILVGLAAVAFASIGLGAASLELGAGTAHADRAFHWCPGQPLSTAWGRGPNGSAVEYHPAITWDMTVCHDWWSVDGQVIEGEPPSCPPLAFMCP
jgi:hypothetical protein